jgi:hypothetical protein
MNLKTFKQIILLLVIATLLFLIVSPKYQFFRKGAFIFRGNKFTGQVEVLTKDDSSIKWLAYPKVLRKHYID